MLSREYVAISALGFWAITFIISFDSVFFIGSQLLPVCIIATATIKTESRIFYPLIVVSILASAWNLTL
jgi:hypothetical protein